MYKISLLILDDEPHVLSSLKRLFHAKKFDVFTASTPSQAIDIIKQKPIGVIISDQRLGEDVEGTDFLAEVKQTWPDISRILLTGFFNSQIAQQSVQKGEVYRFLTKPWNDEDLRVTVENSWQRHQLLKQNRALLTVIKSQNDHLKHLTYNLRSVIENRIDRTVQSKNAIKAKKIQLQITHALIKGLSRSRNLKEIFKIVVKELQKLITFDTASIVVKLSADNYLLLNSKSQSILNSKTVPYLEELFDKSSALISKDVPNLFEGKSSRYRSSLVFPLIDESQSPKTSMATLNLATFMPNTFSVADIEKLSDIANPIAIAIEKMKLLEIVEQGARQWESTFDAIDDLVTVIDKDFNLVKANRATEKITHQKVETIIGKKCYEVLAGRKSPCKNCPATQSLQTKKMTAEHEIKDFKDKDYLTWSFPVESSHKPANSMVMYYRDQTELTHLYRQLIQSEKMAAIGNLASSLSHELNNPLTGITAFSQLLSKELGSKHKFYPDIIEIEKASLRCKHIIENLLNFSESPNSHKKTFISINETLEATFPLIQSSTSAKQNIQISKSFGKSIPKVKGNANELQQVFFNLLLNAIQAMPNGGNLKVKTAWDAASSSVQIIFSDTGEGISKPDLAKIFDPFYTTKEQTRGTGLGLSVSYGIIKDHQGEVEVKSQLKKGSTFKIKLPIQSQKEKGH